MKIKNRDIPILLCCLGIFITPYILRNSLMPSIANINILAYMGLFIAANSKRIYLPLSRRFKFLSNIMYAVFLGVSVFLIFWIRGNGWSDSFKIKAVFIYVLPSLFVYWKISDDRVSASFSEIWRKFLRFACYGMVISWLFDLLLEGAIQHMFVRSYNVASLYNLFEGGRFVSFYGHSLVTAMIFLAFLMWTLIEREKHASQRLYVIDIIVAIFGIATCGSKGCIVVALVMVVLYHTGLKNLKYMIPILILIGLLYMTGAFDLVMDRFRTAVEAGDITTERNAALTRLVSNGELRFEWLKGHAINYSNTSIIAALEYPFLRWSYTSGILFAIIIYIVYFILPGIKLVWQRKWRVLICVGGFMVYINTFNGISAYNDCLLFYAINIGLVLSVISGKSKKRQLKK